MTELQEDVIGRVADAVQKAYGSRLVSLVLFGSTATGTAGPESDIDLLIIADPLPDGRIPRVKEFDRLVEIPLTPLLEQTRKRGWATRFSPIFKTPVETRFGSPLFWDMTDRSKILYDREDFFALYIETVRIRMNKLGSRRVQFGGGYYWDLKPDYKPGEIFEIP